MLETVIMTKIRMIKIPDSKNFNAKYKINIMTMFKQIRKKIKDYFYFMVKA